ncbi:MAG TPA: VIT family protein [bacterium]|jgi:VIT1/CCC1 family predicted Fe2+/Mn2+ transporter|nr:VIT family protein [bacterium]
MPEVRGELTIPGVKQDLAAIEARSTSYLLQVVQPALLGLMDGSISTLAPLFASAFATRNPHTALLVGTAAAVGAGISMGFAEALSDTGKLTGRGHPFARGMITGVATLIGGILHALPFLIPHLGLALAVAYMVVGIELVVIALIRYRYFRLSFWLSIVQVIVGGGLVFLAGVLIGRS